MATIPRLSHSISIADENHITIDYDDLTSETVSLSPATDPKLYWALADGSSVDLLNAVKDALETAASVNSASVTLSAPQRVAITIASSKTVVQLAFLTTYFRPYHLGFATDTSTTLITSFSTLLGNEIATGDYRIPMNWCPSTEEFSDLVFRRDKVISATADNGTGVDDLYTGHKVSLHDIPEVFAALVQNSIVSQSGHASNVSDLTTGDTNATLESWLTSLGALLGGARPLLYLTPDIATPATTRQVRIGNPELLSGVEGWIEETNLAPLFHDLRFELIEVS